LEEGRPINSTKHITGIQQSATYIVYRIAQFCFFLHEVNTVLQKSHYFRKFANVTKDQKLKNPSFFEKVF